MSFWERFFNAQSDQDWTWGPFVSLRPARNLPIRPWVWARLFLIFTTLGLSLLALLSLAVVFVPRLAPRHQPLPPPLPETLATLQAMAAASSTRLVLLGLLMALPPLFFLFCLPYHWAWNRRAARLVRAGRERQETEQSAETGVWPPPVRTYPGASADPPETGR